MIKKIVWLSFLTLAIAASLYFVAITFKHGEYSTDPFLIQTFRMPAVFVLSIGTIEVVISTFAIQVLTRNRIADASIMGISAINYGALVLVYGLSSINLFMYLQAYVMPFIYMAGSIGLILFIFFLTFKYKRAAEKMIVVGIVLSLTISAFSSMILSNLPYAKKVFLTVAAVGGINITADVYTSTTSIVTMAILGLSLLLFLMTWKKIRICYVDPVKAQTLGINVKFVNFILILITALGSTAGFMELGPIVFVGFVATNLTHLFFRTFNLFKLLLSIVIGLILVFGVYVLNTSLFAFDINIGIIINIIAVPYMLALLLKGRRHETT